MTTGIRTPTDGRGETLMRASWWGITLASLGFYVATALAYYRVLLTQPFLGSTVQPSVLDLESVRLGLAKQGLSLEAYSAILVASQAITTLISCILGILIFWRHPADRLAWIMSLVLILMGTVIPVQAYALAQIYPTLGLVAFVANQIGTAVNLALIWVFPNGRFVPEWSGWTFWLTLMIGFFATLFPDMPFARFVIPIALLLFGSGLLAQIYRYRRVSSAIERQQTKLVVVALAVAPMAWVVSALVLPAFFPALTQTSENAAPYNLLRLSFGNFANLLIPLAIGLAILRYRLWDIDLIIRRTLIYSTITAMLALFYFGAVVVLQQIFRSLTGAGDDLAIIISTLGIAALFNPLRRRVQDMIDRRFYRRKYDTRQVLARFATTARDEVELEKLTGELESVVNETMQPTQVSLWLRK